MCLDHSLAWACVTPMVFMLPSLGTKESGTVRALKVPWDCYSKETQAGEASLQAYWQMREALVWEKPWGRQTRVPG